MHHMPAMYILVIREVASYHFVNYTEQEVNTEREHVFSQKFTMLSTDLRVGVFHYWKQVHYIIFCKCWVFPTLKIILPQQDLDTFREKSHKILILHYYI